MVNKIRLTHYPDRGLIGSIKTEINGVEMQEVRSVQLECPIDGLPTLLLEQYATEGLDVTVEGVVQPAVYFDDTRFVLNVEHPSPTSTRYWVEEVQQ